MSAANIAEIRIGHLAGAVHDAAHDGDLHALQVAGAGADALRSRLEVEEGAAAARAGDELGLHAARACALKDVVGELQRADGVGLGFDAYEVAETIAQQGAGKDRGVEQAREKIGSGRDLGGGGVANPERRAAAERAERFGEGAVAAYGMACDGIGRGIVESENQADRTSAAMSSR